MKARFVKDGQQWFWHLLKCQQVLQKFVSVISRLTNSLAKAVYWIQLKETFQEGA